MSFAFYFNGYAAGKDEKNGMYVRQLRPAEIVFASDFHHRQFLSDAICVALSYVISMFHVGFKSSVYLGNSQEKSFVCDK